MKVHIGSGAVYLVGWINVDLPGPRTFLAHARPDLVKKYATTDANYYGNFRDITQAKLRKGPQDKDIVCDIFGSFEDLPFRSGTVDEILARHAFEHLSITEARRALKVAQRVLAINGVLRLDVPDHDATMELYRKTGDVFYKRHLCGPRRNEYGYHMMSYTQDRLRALVQEFAFAFDTEEPNIHLYPAFTLRFKRVRKS